MSNGISAMFERKAEENRLACSAGDKPDMVNHPPHYTSGSVECIEAIEAATNGLIGIEAYCTGNAIKYLWRWKLKGGKQDLEKAVWYLNYLIDNA